VKTVHLAKGLNIAAEELATQVVAAIGMRGSGKSNVMAVIVEGLLAAGVQVIIVDYVGIWFSVRLDASGKKPSPYPVPVLGGRHGDIRLVQGAGKQVAEALALSGSSAVLDVSDLSKGGRCAFATDFAEALFVAKKLHPGPTFLVLEEAQRFIPQKLYSGQGQERMLGAFEEIAEVGRNYGLGLGMISQRPQKLNKDVLNLTELLFAFQANGVLERKAIAEWVQEKDAEGRSEVNNELPSLARGEALVWSPSWLRVYGRYHTHKKTTYDAGATPMKARAAVKMKALDLASLEASMAEVVEVAKKDDPRALRAEMAKLRAELAKAGKAPAPKATPHQVVVAVPPAMLRTISALRKQVERMAADLGRVSGSAQGLLAALDGASKQAASPTLAVVTNGTSRAPVAIRSEPTVHTDKPLSKAARALLAALAQLGGKGNDDQVSILSGYSANSSTFGNAFTELRNAGLADGPPEARTLTEGGRGALGDVPPPPTGEELLALWLRKLGKAERTFLELLWQHGSLSRSALSEQSKLVGANDGKGYSASSSTFGNALTTLRSARLISGPPGGDVAIAETFRGAP
jgi:uncharacterized protein